MKKALIVVDYQNDFVNGSLGFETAYMLDAKICERIEEALSSGADVIYTLDTHSEDYMQTREGSNLPIPHCIDGSDGHKVFGNTASYLDKAAAVIKKPVFGSWELGEFVRSKGYDAIELCGLVSNICVISNAVICRSALPECEISVHRDCTGSGFADLNEAALSVMASMQVKII